MIFFFLHYPRLMATDTGGCFPKMLLKIADKTLIRRRRSILGLPPSYPVSGDSSLSRAELEARV